MVSRLLCSLALYGRHPLWLITFPGGGIWVVVSVLSTAKDATVNICLRVCGRRFPFLGVGPLQVSVLISKV